ncbi:hypothetical protein H6776_01060 [Candidatus Nomurabacteria bacterium]|nr:hypothetical protein [Candidatus Nomurabacteria bacterium]
MKKYILPFLLIALLLVLFIFTSREKDLSHNEIQRNTNLLEYRNETLGISFYYPKEYKIFSEICVENMPCDSLGGHKIAQGKIFIGKLINHKSDEMHFFASSKDYRYSEGSGYLNKFVIGFSDADGFVVPEYVAYSTNGTETALNISQLERANLDSWAVERNPFSCEDFYKQPGSDAGYCNEILSGSRDDLHLIDILVKLPFEKFGGLAFSGYSDSFPEIKQIAESVNLLDK